MKTELYQKPQRSIQASMHEKRVPYVARAQEQVVQ